MSATTASSRPRDCTTDDGDFGALFAQLERRDTGAPIDGGFRRMLVTIEQLKLGRPANR